VVVALAGPYAQSFAPCSRQITTSAPHHSIFTGRILFLTPNRQYRSTEGKKLTLSNKQFPGHEFFSYTSLTSPWVLLNSLTLSCFADKWSPVIGHFPGQPGPSSSTLVFFPGFLQTQPLGTNVTGFSHWMPFLSPNQQCHHSMPLRTLISPRKNHSLALLLL